MVSNRDWDEQVTFYVEEKGPKVYGVIDRTFYGEISVTAYRENEQFSMSFAMNVQK